MTADIKIAIVTSSWNRGDHLHKLAGSLAAQTDKDFVWVIADDASEDETPAHVHSLRTLYPFDVHYVRNDHNLGKGATLNRVFDAVMADLYVIVDSDDQLVSTGVANIRAAATRYESRTHVGALFFRYQLANGQLIGPPLPAEDRVASRAENDALVGKYDGCVAYYSRALHGRRYPEFSGETYIGPTVLQLQLHPEFRMAFINQVIGVAEYQDDGLTASGRLLRLRNPLGMLFYANLQRRQTHGWLDKCRAEARYQAYARVAGQRPATTHTVTELIFRPVGWMVARIWQNQSTPTSSGAGCKP